MPTAASPTTDLLRDLQSVACYASRVGLPLDPIVLAVLKRANARPASTVWTDDAALLDALGKASRNISPMTLADLQDGRDPFLPGNQDRARRLQLRVSFVALFLVLYTLWQTTALREQQAAVEQLQQLEESRPQKQFDDLRRLIHTQAEFNKAEQQYREKVDAFRDVNRRIAVASSALKGASENNLFVPFISDRDSHAIPADQLGQILPDEPSDRSIKVPTVTKAVGWVAAAEHDDGHVESQKTEQVPDRCATGVDGKMILPPQLKGKRQVDRDAFMDRAMELCFYWNAALPGGAGSVAPDENLEEARLHKAKNVNDVEDRVKWILPLCFGMLGAIVFLIRNLGNVRTPSMNGMQVTTRLVLGGLAGVAVGWFSTPGGQSLHAGAGISLPFLIAFLTGYGIDIFFAVLDRGRRMVMTEPQQSSATQGH